MTKTNFLASAALVLLCLFCFAKWGCSHSEQPRRAAPAFYHWRTHLRLGPAERSYLDSLGAQRLYAKFFDVDWDGAAAQPVPLATIELDTALLAGLEIVPCVFITNRTLLNLPVQGVDSLAARIFQKINALAASPPREIQFDCDWTERTRENYFALLTAFRQLALSDPSFTMQRPSFIISATIRLHQLKYPDKTGVPPADRGMLMCYNTGDLEDWATENSILDTKTLKSYLPHLPVNRQSSTVNPYPLPLDIALPVFRWGVLFRDGRMIKLLNNLSAADLQDTSRFKGTAANRYEVVRSTYLHTQYLYVGDQIRLEAVDGQTLAHAAAVLRKHFEPHNLLFYHLDTATLRLFPKERIGEVLGKFRVEN